MSLTSSMWSSVSGLLAHGQKMSTIGNNISNVNTVGYKSSRMDFADMLYQNIGTLAGTGQVGNGTRVGIIMNNYAQGAFETTTNVTDIAISGNGFYRVSPLNSDTNYYTRAGNFHLNSAGYLMDPNGYVLQGWQIEDKTYGSPTDIRIDTNACDPKHTTQAGIQVVLPASDGNDKSESTSDPFFALLQQWDATQSSPLGSDMYAYQTTMDVYDEGGTLHTLTIYYDRVTSTDMQDIDNENPAETYWEYVITMNPAEDYRDYDSQVGDQTATPNVPDQLKGLLGAGTLTFNSSGQMTDMTCFVPQTDGTAGDTWWTDPDGIANNGDETVDLTKWVAAPVNSDGLPVICANFSGTPGLQNAYEPGDYTRPNDNATGRLIAIDFGLSSSSTGWTFGNVTTPSGLGGLVSAADIGDDQLNAKGMGSYAKRVSTATKCQGTSYQELNKTQDGYSFGYLSGLSVSQDGIISGTYSNGVSIQLYQIALYGFASTQNLQREGNNLFSETAASGQALAGTAGTGLFGTTQAYSLEQSNVDLTTEFVNMITTQRGFQANSKSITTVDTMLETVISMKR